MRGCLQVRARVDGRAKPLEAKPSAGVHAMEPFRILLICEGNVCRSPTAALLLDRWLAGSEPAQFIVESAGTRALVGKQIEPEAAAQLPRDIDTSPFRARQLTTEMVKSADVVLALDRRQRGLAARCYPKALHRSFTLREFGRMASYRARHPEARPKAGGAAEKGMTSALRWAQLVTAASAIRPFTLAQAAEDDDVTDPYGGTPGDYKASLRQIQSAMEDLRKI